MLIETQYKLKENNQLSYYLRTHSYWYKYLNRNPDSIDELEREYKETMRKQKMERASEALSALETLTTIVNTLK